MMEQDSLLGSLLVCQWSCGNELLDETTIKYTYTGALMAFQTGCLGALHGEQSLPALNRWGMLVFKKNIIWNVLVFMISTSGYYTPPVNSLESTEFTKPMKIH